MAVSASSKFKSYLTATGIVFFTIGLAFILASIFNQTNPQPNDTGYLVTINGENQKYNIVGRKLVLSDGIYFTGIKYGSAWKLQPVEPVEMTNELQATKWGNDCASSFYKNGSHDCLSLNIYECNQMNDHYLPVLVYLHEGTKFLDSTANLDTSHVVNNLACKGLIVVSVHYRQNIFGNFNFLKPNSVIHEVELALKWINKNIKHFKGDHKRITLMGSQHGAQIASYLGRKANTRTLFSNLILVSGAVDDPNLFVNNYQKLFDQMHRISNYANCTEFDDDLRSKSPSELEDIMNCVRVYGKKTLIRFDNKLGWMQRWPIDSRELLKEDNVEMPPMNVMIGTCENPQIESVEPMNKKLLKYNLQHIADYLRTNYNASFYKFYYDKFGKTNFTVEQALLQMRHDFIEVGPMLLDAFKHAKNPNSKVYAFNLETMRTRTDYNSEIQNLNSEELAPCVEHLLFRKVPKSDQLLKNFMADSIANFVIRGNPNKLTDNLKWSSFFSQQQDSNKLPSYNVLNLNENGVEIQENKWNDSAKFWLCQLSKARNETQTYCS